MNAQEKSAQLTSLRAALEQKPEGFSGMSARERLALLFDEGSFVEVGAFVRQRPSEFGTTDGAAEGVVTGYGAVNGVLVFAFAQDPSVLRGSVSEMHAAKIVSILQMARKAGAPVVSFLDSCGLRLKEGIDALTGYGKVLSLCSEIRGELLHICVLSGVCSGALSFIPAFADYVIALEGAELFLSSPDVLPAGSSSDGWKALVSAVCSDDAAAAGQVRQFLNAFRGSDGTDDDVNRLTPELETVLSVSGYDVNSVVACLADNGVLLPFLPEFAPNLVTGLICLDGLPVGVVANQPAVKDGSLDGDAARKAGRFLDFCDRFAIPVLSLVDTEGFSPDGGADISACGELLAAYTRAETVKITLITGRAYGAGYLTMGSKSTGADVVLALPTAQIASLPARTGAVFLGQQDLANASSPVEKREELIASYAETLASPVQAAARGEVDDIIAFATARQLLISSLNLFLQDGEC